MGTGDTAIGWPYLISIPAIQGNVPPLWGSLIHWDGFCYKHVTPTGFNIPSGLIFAIDMPPLRGCGERECYATNIIPQPQKPRRGDMMIDGDWVGEMETLEG